MVTLVPFRRALARAALLAAVVALGLVASLHARGDQSKRSDGGELFARVWAGVENAERAVTNACGRITETRVSKLFERPLVLRGTFCAAGMTAFRLDYTDPSPLRVIYNDGILNVKTQGGQQTEVMDIGRAVSRTQDYFGGPHALENVRRDFSITTIEEASAYTVRLEPLSKRFASRIREVVARLNHGDFSLRRLEIRGRSGVDSLFDVDVERKNVSLDAQTFQVQRPKGKTAAGNGY